MKIIVFAAWGIEKTSNDFTFNQLQPNLYRCRKIFTEEIANLLKKLANLTKK